MIVYFQHPPSLVRLWRWRTGAKVNLANASRVRLCGWRMGIWWWTHVLTRPSL